MASLSPGITYPKLPIVYRGAFNRSGWVDSTNSCARDVLQQTVRQVTISNRLLDPAKGFDPKPKE